MSEHRTTTCDHTDHTDLIDPTDYIDTDAARSGTSVLSEEDAVTQKTPKRSVRNTAQRTALKQMWVANPLEGNERAESISFGPAVVPLTLRIPSGFPSADITCAEFCGVCVACDDAA